MCIYGGPNCLCVTTLSPQALSYYIHYIHDIHTVSDCVLLLHNTKFGMILSLTVQCQLNKNSLMYQELIIVYLIVTMCSQKYIFCHILTWHVSEKIFHTVTPYSIIQKSITSGIFVMNLKIHTKSWDYGVKV